MPPSEMHGTPVPSSASATVATAVICGMPTPATIRVVQIEPGPMPTLTPSAPASMSAFAASAVTMLPAISCRSGYCAFDRAHALEHVARMAVRRVDDDDVDAGLDEQRDALVGVDAGADGRADAQRAARVLAGERVVVRFLDVLHGDHAAKLEAFVLVDDEHLLDAVLVQEAEHVVLVGAFAHRDEPIFRRHDGRDRRVALRLEPQDRGASRCRRGSRPRRRARRRCSWRA